MRPNLNEIVASENICGNVNIPNSDGLLHQPSPVLPAYDHLPESRTCMEELTPAEWNDLTLYRLRYNQIEQARQALEMLAASKNSPSYGFRVNNYRHCLQCATMLYRDGADEETIVCGLFHDLGFIVCPDNHGEFSAALLGNYISEKHHWMLRHHALFLDHHASGNLQLDAKARENYRGHSYFEYTAEWVARYDQTAIQTQYETAPLEFFESMVYRVFTRPSKGVKLHY
jgi:predicted HD phosphohydrolase